VWVTRDGIGIKALNILRCTGAHGAKKRENRLTKKRCVMKPRGKTKTATKSNTGGSWKSEKIERREGKISRRTISISRLKGKSQNGAVGKGKEGE